MFYPGHLLCVSLLSGCQLYTAHVAQSPESVLVSITEDKALQMFNLSSRADALINIQLTK